MILEPCNVELTKIHYYDHTKRVNNISISTISREVCQNHFNRNVIIKRNVFGQKWVLNINENRDDIKKTARLKVVVYILVFCSLVVAVCFGIFFSIYKNRYKSTDNKLVHIKPITNTTDLNEIYLNVTKENQTTVQTQTTEASVNKLTRVKETFTTGYLNVPSTSSSMCGTCSVGEEVCLKVQEVDTPKCVKILDKNDPTGCGGLCPINTHFCQILDSKGKVYQCFPVKKALKCPNNTFNCGNMCISNDKRCDGLVHCSNFSDEKNCVCNLETHFHCGNLTSCLEKKKKCDRKVDCWDKSDEVECINDISCNGDELPCTSGQCVPKEKLCDGKFDCSDRSDEPEGCQI